MTAGKPVSAGFRCDPLVYEDLKKIAKNEERSIGAVINIMVKNAVLEYRTAETLIKEPQ
jgi:hypothetical protein